MQIVALRGGRITNCLPNQTSEGRWYSCGITPGVNAAMESDSELILPCRLHLNTKAGRGVFVLNKQ